MVKDHVFASTSERQLYCLSQRFIRPLDLLRQKISIFTSCHVSFDLSSGRDSQ